MSQLPHSIPGIVPNGDGGYVWADPIKRAESNARHAAFIAELNAERNARKAERNARKAERNAMYAAKQAERNAMYAAKQAERNARKAERNARSAATRKAAQNDLPTGGKRKSKRNNRKNRSTMKKRRG